jgi:GTP-binding protein Era
VQAIPDADVALFLVDVSQPPGEEERTIADILRGQPDVPVLLVLNKADLVADGSATSYIEAYRELGVFDDWLLISALHGDQLERLLEAILERLPTGPRFYPEDQITDQQLRFMAAELVREAVLRLLHQEVPHSVAVVVDQFKERSEELTYVSANIFVERETQKAIILGEKGKMIKRIGRDARHQIEDLLGTRVYLELWVKVRKKWRRDEKELRRLGYALPQRRE